MPKKNEATAATPTEDKSEKYKDRRWSIPSKRAKGYAEERKAKVHKWGKKEGTELTDFEAGIRSGYLQCQNDHSGVFKYSIARKVGMSKSEAKTFSQTKGINPPEKYKDAIDALLKKED
jgi:hypothetical protein